NYAAAKGGLNALTMTLAKELARFGITVNGIAPGYVDTDMTARLSSRQREKALASVPTGRFGQPEDVAPLVRFLASREADYITGQIIRVDGGLVL
ncbi:MAG: SDR family oxidoreductase, partial [Propionibacteriaceae bacterium]|nr:SDR family oxidoreductase [Propionibacteriaceae bacterium]